MRAIFVFLSVIFFQFGFAQNKDNQTLFTLGGKNIKVSEFKKAFDTSSALHLSENQNNFDDHLDLFIKFHLKLKEAEEQEIDLEADFLKEFNKHFTQLADNYIANGKVTDEIIEETYNRLKTEVKASHILVRFEKNSPKDKQNALSKIDSILTEIDTGKDFETLALQYSDDPSVVENKGDMGWFKAFKMVYPFEDAVYQLEVDEISAPVETRFGFHIIKKTDERPSVGKIVAAHILIIPEGESDLAKQHIDNIYQMLLKGEDFYDLAKQFSQDKATAANGGKMPAFEIGNVNSKKFEEEVFGLQSDGDISQPFKTRFGWHIVKRIAAEPVADLEVKREELRKKIKTSDRSKMLKQRIEANIRSYYTVEEDDQATEFFLQRAGDQILANKWKIPNKINYPNQYFLTIDEAVFSYKDLAEYIEKNQRGSSKKNASAKIKKLIKDFVYNQLVAHHKNRLAELDPEFNESLFNYRNGMMIYEVMNRNVWNKAKDDSLAVREFYNNNTENYRSTLKFKADLASFKNQEEAEHYQKKMLNNQSFDEQSINENYDLVLVEENKEFSPMDSAVPKELEFKKGVSEVIFHNNRYLVFNIREIDRPKHQDFEEVRGRVISDYQDQLEEKWIESLKKKYPVELNEDAIQQTKAYFESL